MKALLVEDVKSRAIKKDNRVTRNSRLSGSCRRLSPVDYRVRTVEERWVCRNRACSPGFCNRCFKAPSIVVFRRLSVFEDSRFFKNQSKFYKQSNKIYSSKLVWFPDTWSGWLRVRDTRESARGNPGHGTNVKTQVFYFARCVYERARGAILAIFLINNNNNSIAWLSNWFQLVWTNGNDWKRKRENYRKNRLSKLSQMHYHRLLRN